MRSLFSLLILSILLTSCGTPEFKEADLHGDWKLELADVDGYCEFKKLEPEDCDKAQAGIRQILSSTQIEFTGSRTYHAQMPGAIKEVNGSYEYDDNTKEIHMFPVQDSLNRLNNQWYKVLKWDGEHIMVEDKDRLIFRFVPI